MRAGGEGTTADELSITTPLATPLAPPVAQAMWELLEEHVFPIPSSEVLFNQYRDVNPDYDLPNGAEIRRRNLASYLGSFSEPPPLLLVGEAAGPWGCRFSGIPFTGEEQLHLNSLPFEGEQSSRDGADWPNHRTAPHYEQSGRVVWGVVQQYHPRFLLWNTVPHHPHKAGQPLSIRTPTGREIARYADLLQALVALIEPTHVAAVGRKAEAAFGRIGVKATYVRHPAHGGSAKFRRGMLELLRDL